MRPKIKVSNHVIVDKLNIKLDDEKVVVLFIYLFIFKKNIIYSE